MKLFITLEAADQIAWFDCQCRLLWEDTPRDEDKQDSENPYFDDRDAFIHQMMRHENRHAIGARNIETLSEGIREEVAGYAVFWPWADVGFWTQTSDHIFVVHPTFNARIIPKRFLTGPDAIEGFAKTLAANAKERA